MNAAKTLAVKALAVVAIPLASFADRTPPAGTATLYGDFSIASQINTGTKVWTNSTDSTRVAWTADSYGIVEKAPSSGSFGLNGLHFWGLKWAFGSSYKRWATMSANVHFGAGGVEMPVSGGALMLGGQNGEARVYMTASQTWTGPESGRANFGFGHDNYQNYYKLVVDGNYCPAWTLEKGMNVWITWTNRFAKTDVTVNYPARIWLEKKWTTKESNVNVAYEGGPALNAKTLTLAGDGTMWEAGGAASANNGYKTPELESEMNSVTVSPSLTLKNGADLLGRSGGWNIPTLVVTGTGESAFDGSWKFRRATTDVSIASGAVLALTGDVADGGVSAGLNVTGSGELKLDPSTFRLTGPLTLGANVTLVLAGHGEFSHRIDGGKEIRIESDGNSPTNVVSLRAAALAGFTGGLVTVASGKAIVDAKAGVSVVEDGGTLVDLSAASGDAWVVTDAVREESEITVGSGETLYVCGNGLTAATALTLNGGRVVFTRSAAVGSPVTVAGTSTIGADSVHVVGTVLGRFNGWCSSSKELKLDGAGTVNLAGGGSFSNVAVQVRGGSANLMSNRFDIAYGHFGVYEGDYLGIRDGAYVKGVYPRLGGLFGIISRPVEYGTSVVEICSNATVYLDQNMSIYLGRWSSEGVLRLSGGSLQIVHGHNINIGYNGGGLGLFEMNDGYFYTDQAFRVDGNKASGRVVWRGGCIKIGNDFMTYAGNVSRYFDGTSSNLTFTISGPNCVLDLNGLPAFTNVVANSLNVGSWRCEEGGRLTVTNGGTFVMNRFPANGRVAVKDCSLLVADAAEPAIGELGFAGTTNDVISAADGLSLAAQGVRVLSGGEWRPSQVGGISWSDLAFDTGAICNLQMTANDAVATCNVPGVLTLGDELGFRVVRNGYRITRTASVPAVRAAGGISGNPSFVNVEPVKAFTMSVDDDDLMLNCKFVGTMISFH